MQPTGEVEALIGQTFNNLITRFKATHIQILIPKKAIQGNGSAYTLIPGRARLQNNSGGTKIESDCYVAYGNWKKLEPFLAKTQGDTIDIVEHIDQFLPKIGKRIGLFTYQNGIQNSPSDCKAMGESILENLQQEKPLCIGLYNKTNGTGFGLIKDLNRLTNPWTLNVNSVLLMRQLLVTLADILPSINPSAFWTHIAHSEAGLILNSCLTRQSGLAWEISLSQEHRAFMRRALITSVYGGVSSISKELVFHSINTYSNKDIALRFIKSKLDKKPHPSQNEFDRQLATFFNPLSSTYHGIPQSIYSTQQYQQQATNLKQHWSALYISKYPHTSHKNGYNITVVDSIAEELPLPQGDHAFLGDTYQTELKENIKDLRENVKIHNARTCI